MTTASLTATVNGSRKNITMRNVSIHPVLLDAEVFDEDQWSNPLAPRPKKVSVPAGAVVSIKSEYALRRQGQGSAAGLIKSVVESLTGGMLQPYGDESIAFYNETLHHQLHSVQLAFASLPVTHASGHGASSQEMAEMLAREEGRRLGVAQALGLIDKKETATINFVADDPST